MFTPGQAFLNAYTGANSFSDRPDLIAGLVLTPNMNPDGTFKTKKDPYTGELDRVTTNVRTDYPALPTKGEEGVGSEYNPYRALGVFGSKEAGGTIDRGYIRGMMDFVPGGIPASPGFNYEETLKAYPEEMKGIRKGNMPVYGSPY